MLQNFVKSRAPFYVNRKSFFKTSIFTCNYKFIDLKVKFPFKMDYFDFEHINLIPKKCIVNSRSECDTSVQIGNHRFKLPVVPANMECVINQEIAVKLASHNYFYIYHRFNKDLLSFAKHMKEKNLILSISIGVNEDAYDSIYMLQSEGIIPDYITIDIAHGHSVKMERMIKFLRMIPEYKGVYIIAGNVSTSDAVRDLENWGANAIKSGIGPGGACSTYMATGFGSRGIQAFTVGECANARQNPKTVIIADGGIREAGDIAKCMALGADMVMIGGMFSGLTDSPGPTVTGADGRLYKEFWGSASEYQSGKSERVEGVKKLIPLQDKSFLKMMRYIEECLQSAISYGGGKELIDLKSVDFIIKK